MKREKIAITRIPAPPGVVEHWLASPAALRRLMLPPAMRRMEFPLAHGGWIRLTPDERPEGEPWTLALAPCRRTDTDDSLRVRALAWRLARVRDDVTRHHASGLAPQRLAVSGASGLIGSALVPFLAAGGHRVDRLVRRKTTEQLDEFGGREISWQPGASDSAGEIDVGALEGVDAFVHLAGDPIMVRRPSPEALRKMRESRIEGTRTIARAVAGLARRPATLVVASGVGYYGDRGEEELREDAGVGSGFFAELARDWEQAADPALQAGIRVAHLRIGIVISPCGGAIRELLPMFRLGLGCVVGSGKQVWSWIGLDDMLGVVLHALAMPSLSGPINAVAPANLSARGFAWTLARACDRSLLTRITPWAIRAAMGAPAEVILASTRVIPERLRASGFRFAHADLARSLKWEMGTGTLEDVGVWTEERVPTAAALGGAE